MDDVELKTVLLQAPETRSIGGALAGAGAGGGGERPEGAGVQEEHVQTDRGQVLVGIQGNRKKHAIITYHDLGLNYVSGFQAFFNYNHMRCLLDHFCVYHINAPGQEEGAPTLPEDYIYPTMDELAGQLNFVIGHFGVKSFIGFGVGSGANILARYSLLHPDKVDALAIVNCISTAAGWIEWGYQKLNARYLRSKGMTQGVLDYLMWYHFGNGTEERNHDLAQVYKSYFSERINPTNLSLFIDAYVRRTDLNISRAECPEPGGKSASSCATTLKIPVLNVTGSLSPQVEDTVTLNGRLDPTNSTWMKLSDCGMVLEEQPGKVSEAFRLFLQGQGYCVNE